jgi:endonuclease/exonuclease/phosphatase family metal-dependent hydrolase
MLEQRTFWLSETLDKPSKGWDAALPRVCTTVRLKHKKSQRIFTQMNVHFDHIGVEARLQSAKQQVAFAQPYLHAGEAVFLIGDFNTTS